MNLQGKRMVIFGCGYLGSRVARQAMAAGAEVTALTRNRDKAAELTQTGIDRVITSRLESSEWHSLIPARQDYVVNCVSSAGGGWAGYRSSYLEGMRSVLQWAAKGEAGAILFTSSTSVYGQADEEWVTENDPAEGSSEGGKILREAEVLLEKASPSVPRWFILRLGGIYGPDRHRLLSRAIASGDSTEEDEVFLNSIHVDDAASAIWAALLSPPKVAAGIFNIVDGKPARKREIIEYLRARVSEKGLKGTGQQATPAKTRRPGVRPSRKISNRRAREVLGWELAFADYKAGYESILANL